MGLGAGGTLGPTVGAGTSEGVGAAELPGTDGSMDAGTNENGPGVGDGPGVTPGLPSSAATTATIAALPARAAARPGVIRGLGLGTSGTAGGTTAPGALGRQWAHGGSGPGTGWQAPRMASSKLHRSVEKRTPSSTQTRWLRAFDETYSQPIYFEVTVATTS